jgi:uncharacterized membrane protein YeaQ/YmgE (transglycosylase-associated protein family)
MLFATLTLSWAGVATWLAVGLIAGWLAGQVMDDPGYGSTGNLVLGSIGGLAGGASLGFFVTLPLFWVAVLVAFIGACVFLGVGHAVAVYRNA